MDGFVNETEWFFIPYMMVGMDRAPLEVQQGHTQDPEGHAIPKFLRCLF
jgi:hypothetical protein